MVQSAIFYMLSGILFIEVSRKKDMRIAIFFIVLYAAVLSFAHQPLLTDDLTREYANLDAVRKYGWSYFNQTNGGLYNSSLLGTTVYSSKFQGLYVTQLIYYLFSKLPVYNFMPAFVVALQYYLEFKLLQKINKKFHFTHKELVFLFLFFFMTRELRWMMSGIRNQLAFTIAVYILYGDLVEGKNSIKSLVGLLLCGMIHQSAYVFFVFRLILYIHNKKVKIIIALVMAFWSYMLEFIMRFLQRFINNSIINSLLWKITIYTQNEGGGNVNVIMRPYYLKMVISDIGLIVFALITLYIYFKKNKWEDNYVKPILKKRKLLVIRKNQLEISTIMPYDYALFILLSVSLTIGSAMYYWLYLRFAMIIQIGLFVVCGKVLHDYRKDNQIQKRNRYMYLGYVAILIKFFIMLFVANGSFYFDLFGMYPR